MWQRIERFNWWYILRTTLLVIICNKGIIFLTVLFYIFGATVWGVVSGLIFAFLTQDPTLVNQSFLQLFRFEKQVSLFAILSDWGGPAMTILLTMAGASWLGRQLQEDVQWQAIIMGAGVALITPFLNEMIGIDPDGLFSFKGVVFFGMTTLAGWLGGAPVHTDLYQARMLYNASRAIRGANNLQELLTAVGENLPTKGVVNVSFWQVVNQDEHGSPLEFLLLSSWSPKGYSRWAPGLKYNSLTELPSWKEIQQKEPFLQQFQDLSISEKDIWVQLGLRSVAIMPMNPRFGGEGADEFGVGIILIGSNQTFGITETILNNYLAIEAQVSLMLENLQLLKRARQTGVLQERERLAHEIHDTLAQGFTSIVMHLEAAEQSFPNPINRNVRQHVHLAKQMGREGLDQARRLVWALRPQPLEKGSLTQALGRVLRKWEIQSRVKTKLTVTGTLQPLHPDIEVTVLRALQESLANIRKYAQAKQVTVTLSYLDDLFVMDVQDDGVGFDYEEVKKRPSSRHGGFGLQGMQRRLVELNGEFTIESEIGEGTTVVLAIPLV